MVTERDSKFIFSVNSFNIYISFFASIAFQNAYAVHVKGQQSTSKWTENKEIQIFREYLRISTVQPDPDYSEKISKNISQLNH